jgi:hypothetical protein
MSLGKTTLGEMTLGGTTLGRTTLGKTMLGKMTLGKTVLGESTSYHVTYTVCTYIEHLMLIYVENNNFFSRIFKT